MVFYILRTDQQFFLVDFANFNCGIFCNTVPPRYEDYAFVTELNTSSEHGEFFSDQLIFHKLHTLQSL